MITPGGFGPPFLFPTTMHTNESDPSGRDPHAPGAKLDHGKTRAWLFMSGFARALEAVAEVTTKGAIKYTPNGWVEVPDGENRYMEGFGRHQFKLGQGHKFDTGPGGTGCRHKAQMIWNLLASLELELRAEEAAASEEATRAIQLAIHQEHLDQSMAQFFGAPGASRY